MKIIFFFFISWICLFYLHQSQASASADIDLVLANIENFQFPELRDPTHSLHKVHKHLNFTMEENERLVKRSGHKWCGLVRGNWVCSGDHYENVLKATAPFDNSMYNLKTLKPGTRIYADGNSYLAQLMYTIICENDEESVIWKLGHEGANSLLVYYNQTDIAILLIDNQDNLSLYNNATISWLRKVGYKPDLLIIGRNNMKYEYKNWSTEKHHALRTSALIQEFPGAILISWLYSHLPCGCATNYCGLSCYHQCFPGPLARNAELLVIRFKEELDLYGKLD